MSTPGMRCAIALQEIGIGITQDTEQLASFIDEKIGKPEQQEPAAVVAVQPMAVGGTTARVRWHELSIGEHSLYTRPQAREWVSLTDDEVRQICGSVPVVREAVREAEAKLKELNT